MAFRKKAGLVLAYKPDILVVPECECPDNLKFDVDFPMPADILWFGENRHKGLGIFSYSDFRFRVRKTHKPELKTIVPISVTGGHYDFTLYAVWANNPGDPDGQYVEQIWKAIHHYRKHLTGKPSMLVGDFNSNSIWDKKYREGNHSNVVKFLEAKGIISTYHLFHGQTQGKEKHPTLYMYRHEDKPYHIDYCFASKHFTGRIGSVEVGDFKSWSRYSDHVPVMVTFKLN